MRRHCIIAIPIAAIALGSVGPAIAAPDTPSNKQLSQSGQGGAVAVPPSGGDTRQAPAAKPGGAITRMAPDKQVQTDAPPAMQATALQGKDIVGPDGRKVGKVEDVLGGKIVTSVGGFLGIGSKMVLLPPDKVNIARIDGDLMVLTNLTAKEVERLPTYSGKATDAPSRSDGETVPN